MDSVMTGPRHSTAQQFVQSGLFDGLSTFKVRISPIVNTQIAPS
jgi:hypothetical protein